MNRRQTGRYAPSPTGPLHPGNLRTALLAWMQARLAGGRFILRMEDLDRARTRPGCAARITEDLRWLGLDWDEGPDCGGPAQPYEQSRRDALYEYALRALHEQGALFPCYCSRKDIAQAASAPHDAHPVYPGTCRQRRTPPPAGHTPAWRYRAPQRLIRYTDALSGPRRQALAREAGDFVVRRADGLFAYQLAVVVDDALMGVTDVVRGADLQDSTPRQIELFGALGYAAPRYWHVPLMRDERGRRLAKRDQDSSLQALRDNGMRPPDVIGMLAASLGWAGPGASLGAAELLERFTPETFRTALQEQTRAVETGCG